jgi:hypothetical protein
MTGLKANKEKAGPETGFPLALFIAVRSKEAV